MYKLGQFIFFIITYDIDFRFSDIHKVSPYNRWHCTWGMSH